MRIAQKICAVPSGHDPGYAALGVPAGADVGQDGPRCAFQLQPFCDSVMP